MARGFFWKLINRQGAISTYRTPVPGGWLIWVSDGRSNALSFLGDSNQTWAPTTIIDLDPGFFAQYLRLREVVRAPPGVALPGPPNRTVDINFDHVILYRAVDTSDNAPSGSNSLVVAGAQTIFVEEKVTDIEDAVQSRRWNVLKRTSARGGRKSARPRRK